MTRRNKEQTAHEIRKLEQELENLERSYAAFERGALWAQKAFFVFIAALLALVLWGVVVALLPLIVVFGIWYFQRPRWIDVVSGGLGKEHPDEKSGAEVLEAQILQWKARLAVLRGERSAEAGGAGIGQAALVSAVPPGSGNLGIPKRRRLSNEPRPVAHHYRHYRRRPTRLPTCSEIQRLHGARRQSMSAILRRRW